MRGITAVGARKKALVAGPCSSNGNISEAHDVDEYCGESYLFFLTATTTFKSEDCGISLSGEAVRGLAESCLVHGPQRIRRSLKSEPSELFSRLLVP